MARTEVIEVRGDAPVQLVLPDETFEIMRGLRDAGAITLTSLDLSGADPSFDVQLAIALYVDRVNRSCAWWMGDLLNYSEATLGEEFAQITADLGLSEQTLLQRKAVAMAIPTKLRKANLSFACHVAVHRLPADEMKGWLDRASKGGWTAKQLIEEMKGHRTDTQQRISTNVVDKDRLVEVAEAIAAHAELIEGGDFKIRAEDMAQLRAALGQDGDE